MANEKIYPKGIVCFAKHEKAPDFVLGTVILNVDELIAWLKGDGAQYATDYKGAKQIKLQLTTTRDNRPSLAVDTWKPERKESAPEAEQTEQPETDLPF